MIPNLSGHVMPLGQRNISVKLTLSTQFTIHKTYFHSVIKYGTIFWVNSSNSGKIFTLQKKIIRIMAGAQPRTSCRSLFKQLEILSVSCQYTLSLMKLIVNNQEIFQTNLAIHNINSKNKHQLHKTNANLFCFQKSILDIGINIFNSLPPSVTILTNDRAKFKVTLRKYVHTHPFYSVNEFVMSKDDL